MLKNKCILFLGLVVYVGSVCVTPTHASSASSVIITHIQAGSAASAKDEMVMIYNNSTVAVNISGWCLKNKTNVMFACFNPPSTALAYYLLPQTHLVVASESFAVVSGAQAENIAFIYPVTSQSSGSIVNGNDTVSLVDSGAVVVNSHTWAAAIPTGKLFIRAQSVNDPLVYETLDPLLNWSYGTLPSLPQSGLEERDIIPDDPEDPEDPDNPDNPTNPNTLKPPYITEVLPNPLGADTGNEFIEVYNPNPANSLDLTDYKLKVGVNLEKTYAFPSGTVLQPLEYRAFSNTTIKYTLLNASSSVQLEYNTKLVGVQVTYDTPKEGTSFALDADNWYYTTTPTPNAVNVITEVLEDEDAETEKLLIAAAAVKSCAANQYRHPETNRCRLLATAASSTVTPCKANQYRSPETNRCRNIASTQSTATACKAGQERNPETNRCRNISKMSQAEHGVKGISTEASSGTNWYWWLGIIGVVGLIVSYAVWEWRDELVKAWRLVKQKVAGISR